MTAVLRAQGLGKTYGRRPALVDCTLDVPAGRVVGLVGPNGAGKSTLLNLAVGMLAPTTGTIEVLGGRPGAGPAQLARVGYVAQDTPTYAALSVEDHLRLGARLNPGWDDALARDRVRRLGLDLAHRAGNLSGGQRAQLALTLGIAKHPELLVLDEPVASLDPLARREFLQDLMEAVAEQGLSVVLSSHLLSDIERVCDHLVVLVASRLRLTGDLDTLLATHHRLTGARRDPATLPADQHAGGGPMIWLTWRQFRLQAAVTSAALAVLAVILAVSGGQLADLSDTRGAAFLEQLAAGGSQSSLYFVGSVAVLARCRGSSACSGARRWSRANSKPAPTGSCGTRRSPDRAGWRRRSASPAWPPSPPPGCSRS